ncbi:MAG: PAS domain-containing protein [Gemmataceae bacterium]|nr:PAS domain-containing protein [Gemmataceae bacterium]
MKELPPREESARGKIPERKKSTRKPKPGLGVFEASTDPVFLLDSKYKIQFVNSAMEALAELPKESLLGLSCKGTAFQPTLADLENWLTYALAPPQEAREGQVCKKRVQRPEKGNPVIWEIQFFPLPQDSQARAMVGKIEVIKPESPQIRLIPDKVLNLTAQQEVWEILYLEFLFPADRSRLDKQLSIALAGDFPVTFAGSTATERCMLGRILSRKATQLSAMAFLDCQILPVPILEGILGLGSGRLRAGTPQFLFLESPHFLPTLTQDKIARHFIPQNAVQKSEGQPRLLIGLPRPSQELAARLAPAFSLGASIFPIEAPKWQLPEEEFGRLASQLAEKIHRLLGKGATAFSPSALELLREYSWPGGWGEFLETFTKLILNSQEPVIDKAKLPFHIQEPALHHPSGPSREPLKLEEILARVEKRIISLALARSKGNQTKAASILGIWRPTLIRRMESLGLNSGPNDAGSPPEEKAKESP